MPQTKIILKKGTHIPKWMLLQDKFISIVNKQIRGIKIRELTIKGGDACFFPGGLVGVITPAMLANSGYTIVFKKTDVLKIQKGKTITKNYYFCENCYSLSGELIENHHFRCSLCSVEWDRP